MDRNAGRIEEKACNCKVGRIAREYDLEGFDVTLAERWTDTERRASLRELTREFNQEVVRTAMQSAVIGTLEGEAENIFRLLTSDDVDSGMRVRVRNRLERHGIDPDDLESGFISHQTLHTHFTDCLSVQLDTTKEDLLESERTKVNALQNRVSVVTSDSLERLHDAGEISLDSFDVIVDISVFCQLCGSMHELDTLLERDGCH